MYESLSSYFIIMLILIQPYFQYGSRYNKDVNTNFVINISLFI